MGTATGEGVGEVGAQASAMTLAPRSSVKAARSAAVAYGSEPPHGVAVG